MGVRVATVCAFVLAALAPLPARRLPIKTYTTADGLARDQTQCLVQDHRGFLWICTAEGLSRFDGYGFTNYGVAQGLPANNVYSFLETREGVFWAGTNTGLARFDPGAKNGKRFVPYPMPGDRLAQVINSLRDDRDGTIWCGTDHGLFRLRKGAPAFEPVRGDADTVIEGEVLALMQDREGALWIGTSVGLYVRRPDGRIQSYSSLLQPSPRTLAILQDRGGRIWIGTGDSLWRMNRAGAFEKLSSKARVFSLTETSEGEIWAGTAAGLAQHIASAAGHEEFEWFTQANGLAGRQIPQVLEDRDGNLWLGSDGGGLMKMSRHGFVTYSFEDGLGEPSPNAGAILENRDGRYFVRGPVISRFDGQRFHPTLPAFPREITNFGWGAGRLALTDHAGEWWIATAQGLCRFPAVPVERLPATPPSVVYRKRDGLPGDAIFQLFEDSRGGIWIGTVGEAGGGSPGDQAGLARWDRKSGRMQAFPQFPFMPTGFAEDGAGNVWAGAYSGELARIGATGLTDFTSLAGVPRGGWKIPFVDSAGRLWIVARRGLGRADDPTAPAPHFVTYTTAHGLASDDIKAIAEDRWGRIYVASGRGLDRIEPQPAGIGTPKHYTSADGLVTGELRTAYCDRSGDLWFATNQGISQWTPSPGRPRDPPPVLITGFEAGAAKYPLSDTGETNVTAAGFAEGQWPMRIEFLGLTFAAGDRLRYQYRLQGVDDWSAPGDQRTVAYGRMASGAYRFQVRAVNSEGIVSAEPAAVLFRIPPPFWATWWFVSIAALASGSAIYAAHRFRVRQILAVERVRTRIATDLHDDIGSSLTQISILSELARQRLNGADDQVTQPLREIAAVSSEMVAALSDIVWAINPRHDRLHDLVARMRRFALDVLGGRGIELRFEAAGQHDGVRTAPEFRRQVYLIFKEAINNVARHAGCTQAAVTLGVEKGRLELQISDNGNGFARAPEDSGNGLRNMQRRAAELHGEFHLHSQPGGGTRVRLRVPFVERSKITPKIGGGQ